MKNSKRPPILLKSIRLRQNRLFSFILKLICSAHREIAFDASEQKWFLYIIRFYILHYFTYFIFMYVIIRTCVNNYIQQNT